MGRYNIPMKAMHTYGLNMWSHILCNKRYLVTHMIRKRERYNNNTTTSKLTQQMSAATVQHFTGLYKFWASGCLPTILLLCKTHQISEKFIFSFSFIPCISLPPPYLSLFCFLPLSSSLSARLKQSSMFYRSTSNPPFCHILFSSTQYIRKQCNGWKNWSRQCGR